MNASQKQTMGGARFRGCGGFAAGGLCGSMAHTERAGE